MYFDGIKVGLVKAYFCETNQASINRIKCSGVVHMQKEVLSKPIFVTLVYFNLVSNVFESF